MAKRRTTKQQNPEQQSERFNELQRFHIEDGSGLELGTLHYDAPAACRPFQFLSVFGLAVQTRQQPDGAWVYRVVEPAADRRLDPLVTNLRYTEHAI